MPESNSNIDGQESENFQQLLKQLGNKIGQIGQIRLDGIEPPEDKDETSEFKELCKKIEELLEENNEEE